MKLKLAISVTAAGMLAVPGADAAGGGGFAGGGFSAASTSSGSSSSAHGGARSAAPSSARSGSASRPSASGGNAARNGASNYRFAPSSARGGDSFRNFAPGSVVPFAHGGFVRGGFNGACFNGQFCWNGRRYCLPFRYGARCYGNGYLGGGYAYFGSDYLGSDYETQPPHRHEAAYQPPMDPTFVPVVVAPSAEPPAAVNAAPGPVSREFAYGSIVSDVQNRLASEGFFRGSIDGFITAGTRTAIAMFQDQHQLVITGRIDTALLQAMGLKPST